MQNKQSGGFRSLLLLPAIFFYLPLAINVNQVGAKPIDVVISDIFISALLLVYLYILFTRKIGKSEWQMLFLLCSTLLFFVLLSIVGYVENGRVVAIFSAIKFEKIFFAVAAGMCFSRFCSFDNFWRISAFASLVVITALCFTQFIQVGSFLPRWGGNLLGVPVYGFPNSAASYYVLLVMFSVVACFRGYGSYKYVGVALFASLFMVMSLSRSAILVLMVFCLLTFLGRFFFKFVRSPMPLVLILVMFCLFVFYVNFTEKSETATKVMEAIELRWDRTFSSNDPTSGRIDIAIETLSLIAERPFFGYKFDSFSNYQKRHDTTHNQYLELLFKSGFIGTLLYLGTLGFIIWAIYKRTRVSGVSREDRDSVICFLNAVLALLVGNLSQPNFTYSQTGNILFFALGFLVMWRPEKVHVNNGDFRPRITVRKVKRPKNFLL